MTINKMEQIKSAFLKVKQDIQNLNFEIAKINNELKDFKRLLIEFQNNLNKIKSDFNLNQEINPTIQQINPTHSNTQPTVPTHQQEFKGLKSQNLRFSIGNEGVPTDTQQTNKQTSNRYTTHKNNIESDIREVSGIINSLDRLKKEIRQKFKQLTSQEMLVFSTIYQLEEKDPKKVTYNNLSILLNLSEISIRDYIFKMIKKGIPIKKTKINNRKILLSISNELKKITSLSTIIQLREL